MFITFLPSEFKEHPQAVTASPGEQLNLNCSGSVPKVSVMTAGWQKDGGNVDPQMVVTTVGLIKSDSYYL